jgi:hypothetical protein
MLTESKAAMVAHQFNIGVSRHTRRFRRVGKIAWHAFEFCTVPGDFAHTV